MFDRDFSSSFSDSQEENKDTSNEAEGNPSPSLEDTLSSEIEKLKGDLLRAMAETENVRKRAQKEKEDAFKYAISNFARDLTTVCENLRRACSSISQEEIQSHPGFKSFFEGVDMTEKELLSVFDRHGIKRIAPQPGDMFDHNLHQAMFEVEDASKPAGTIMETMQAGYMLHDRLLKPAFVGVSKRQG